MPDVLHPDVRAGGKKEPLNGDEEIADHVRRHRDTHEEYRKCLQHTNNTWSSLRHTFLSTQTTHGDHCDIHSYHHKQHMVIIAPYILINTNNTWSSLRHTFLSTQTTHGHHCAIHSYQHKQHMVIIAPYILINTNSTLSSLRHTFLSTQTAHCHHCAIHSYQMAFFLNRDFQIIQSFIRLVLKVRTYWL